MPAGRGPSRLAPLPAVRLDSAVRHTPRNPSGDGMSRTVDPARFRDPALRPIAGKVLAGRRLEPADGLTLHDNRHILSLGGLAASANDRRNGDRVFFSANQHLNPTNVCVLRTTCVFCSFARTPKEDGAYTRSLEEVYQEAEQARGAPTREFHIVGGLHPTLP